MSVGEEQRIIAVVPGSAERCLVVTTSREGACHVVGLAGELDLSSRHLVGEACATGAGRPVVVDLSLLTFMDCGGYGSLIAARIGAEERGGSLLLRNLVGEPARLVDLLSSTSDAGADVVAREAESTGAERPSDRRARLNGRHEGYHARGEDERTG